uniref:H15 domain-containing protein n=1 Tax=Oryza punctata TaxID=4537 RepID=A0A0E0KI54_ORYPU
MIVEAIASLAEENGSSQAAIARRIEAAHGAGAGAGRLPPSYPALVAAHLSRMSAAGELVAVAGGKYALRPTPPPPPPAASAAAAEEEEEEEFLADDDSADDLPPPPPKRGRGRPPKVRPPGYPAVPPAAAAHAPIGAPVDGSVAAAAPAVPRRRGRPPKPRDPHAPPKIPRPRGRPRKNPLPEGMVPPPPRPGATAKPRPQFAEVGFV